MIGVDGCAILRSLCFFGFGFAKFLLIGCASLRRSHAKWLMSNFEAAAFVVIVALMVAMAVIVS